MTPVTFTRDDIIAAFEELADLLAENDVSTSIRVVGGAALAVLHGREATTTDIDALYGAPDAVRHAVTIIAARRGWPDSWLNNNVALFASHFDHTATWVPFTSRGSVEVSIAPADLLLAMKLLAGRGRRDAADIDLLCDACGVTSTTEAEAIFDRYYPETRWQAWPGPNSNDAIPPKEIGNGAAVDVKGRPVAAKRTGQTATPPVASCPPQRRLSSP